MIAERKYYDFEGHQLTITEIAARYPAIGSVNTVRKHLTAGRTTLKAMLAYDSRPARIAGAQLGRKTGVANGFNERFMAKAKRK